MVGYAPSSGTPTVGGGIGDALRPMACGCWWKRAAVEVQNRHVSGGGSWRGYSELTVGDIRAA